MAEGILKAQRHKNRVAGMKLPTAQDRAALGFFLQGQKGVQGVADAGEGQGIVNGVNNPRRGGPAVEEGHLMGLQQRGRMASGTAFFLDQPGFLIAEQVMGSAARLQHNVSAEQHNRAAVAIEVATNGHFRHPKQGGGFFQM